MISDRRLGYFELSKRYVDSRPAVVAGFLAQVRLIRETFDEARQVHCYEGHCELFDALDEAEPVPRYILFAVPQGLEPIRLGFCVTGTDTSCD